MRQRDLDRAITAVKKAIKTNQKMRVKYTKKVKTELEKIGKSVIDEWYSDYIPNNYWRQYSLYKAYRITANPEKGTFNVSFSSNYMKGFRHMTGKKTGDINEYIFDISFLQGWHGGANKGPDHPYPDIPMYRMPPYWEMWYYIAEKSFSPYEEMYGRMNDKLDEIDQQYEEEFKHTIYDKINHHINILKGGTK